MERTTASLVICYAVLVIALVALSSVVISLCLPAT
jgi:hypothetical protein